MAWKDQEKKRRWHKAYYQANRVQKDREAKAWKKAHPKEVKGHALKKRYGMSIAMFDRMVAEQKGRCGLCEVLCKLYVDHCHDSGTIRKLLCRACNIGLGHFREDPEVLRRAAQYIEDYAQWS